MAGTLERQELAILVGCYLTARLLIVATMGPTSMPDTPGYFDISLIGGAGRPWVLPVLFAVTTDWMLVALQTAISAAAFVAVALAVGSTIRDSRASVAAMAAVLLIGITPRVTMWDALLATESLAISFTLLLIAVAVWLDRVPTWALLALFVGWVFVRDSHALLALLVATPFVVALWRQRRRVAVFGLVAVLLWGVAASQHDRSIEAYNVTSNVNFRVSYDPDRFRWFIDNGMPVSDAFFIADPFERRAVLAADSEFQEWAEADGAATYAKFLLTHPDFTMQAVGRIFVDDQLVSESISDRTFALYADPDTPRLGWLWPDNGNAHAAVAVLAALGGLALVASKRRLDKRFVVPILLLVSTIPHAILVFHGAPIELARHGLVLMVVLMVSCVWLVALAADDALDQRPHFASRMASAAAMSEHESQTTISPIQPSK